MVTTTPRWQGAGADAVVAYVDPYVVDVWETAGNGYAYGIARTFTPGGTLVEVAGDTGFDTREAAQVAAVAEARKGDA